MKTPNGSLEVERLFGNPAASSGSVNLAWENDNIKLVLPPQGWTLYYQEDHDIVPSRGIRMHKLLEESFQEVMTEIWNHARIEVKKAIGYDHTTSEYDELTRKWLHERHLDIHGGGFNYRKKRSGSHLSMHSYGIAIDWDPLHNPRGHSGEKTLPNWWYEIWHLHGWHDGRHFPTPDPMHVQFASGV